MDIYTCQPPQQPLPLIFDSPHSGTHYPAGFDYACDFHELRKAEDTYVEDLFSNAPALGGALLAAHTPRSYIDLNRAADDIDLNLMDAPWPDQFHITPAPSSRSDAGIGLIRRLVRPGIPVYARPLTAQEIVGRIDTYYTPYHEALDHLIKTAHYDFGQVWHINCHSMPDRSARPNKASLSPFPGTGPSLDFVLGNRDGTTSCPEFTALIKDYLTERGYRVALNDPFKGVELIRRYSAPTRGRHSIQLEINKSLYMNEETLAKNDNYDAFKKEIENLITFIADYARSCLIQRAAD